jgi:hypothetical protein
MRVSTRLLIEPTFQVDYCRKANDEEADKFIALKVP